LLALVGAVVMMIFAVLQAPETLGRIWGNFWL